jgi:hypothetical protein
MQPLDLNLASRPFRNNVLLWGGYSLAAALLVGSTIWNVHAYVDYGSRLEDLRKSVTSIERRTADLDLRSGRAEAGIKKFDLKSLGIQTSTANEVILRKALSWTRLFNLLEKVQPYGVRMTSIRPVYLSESERRSGRALEASLEGAVPVSVEGSAQNLDEFLEFERALLGDRHFDRVEPERSTFAKNGSELLFELRFLYYPEGRAGEAGPLPPLPGAAAGGTLSEGTKSAEEPIAGSDPATAPASPTSRTSPPPTAPAAGDPAASSAGSPPPRTGAPVRPRFGTAAGAKRRPVRPGNK